jgi:membrane protease YdiL (CAAX protease family)
VLWAVLFVVATNVEFLAPLERQILFNLVFLMGGSTLFLIHRYKLDPRKVLALRWPRPAAWMAVILGAPAGHIAGIGLFKAANLIFPVPEKFMEALGEGMGFFDKPLWVLLFWIAVMPGIFEELFFRGVLLHAWRRRFRPLTLVLVVSCIFGFFHVSLYRLIPTTYIGMLLGAMVLLTGSILPAMLWHALNNASAVLAGHFGVPVDDLSWWVYVASFAVLALVFWILYRTRTPYPELRPWRRRRTDFHHRDH